MPCTAHLPLALVCATLLSTMTGACAHSPAASAGDGAAATGSAPPTGHAATGSAAATAIPHAAPGAAELAALVMERFASGTTDAFDSVYPLAPGRGLVGFATSRNLPRRPGIARVVWSDSAEAVIALSGHVEFGNTGDETIYAENFSGLYEAHPDETGAWRIGERIPLEAASRINSQVLDVTLMPAHSLRVTDTLEIVVHDRYGFATRLNHAAEISSVRLGGRPADYEFGGGLLWVRSPQREREQLVLEYVIDVARDSSANPNSGRFEQVYGHVRNQYYWHPRSAGTSDFMLTVRGPAAYYIASDLPQRDEVAGSIRTVRSRSDSPVPALSLFYDRDWQPETRQAGSLRLTVFATPDFRPAPDSLATAFARVHSFLSERFGEPHGGYTAVVQGRARQGAGWLYLSNNAIVTAAQGGAQIQAAPLPRAYFGHEVAHAWTQPTGPASNLLSEGWATFVESLLLADQYGPDVERAFWEHQRNRHHVGGFEGRSILDDPQNSGIAYHKGAWIFRMLRDAMGEDAFRRGLREYMRITPGEPAGLHEFVAALSRAAGRDMEAFLRPWVEDTTLPHVTARVERDHLIVTQHGALFRLPLELELSTRAGPVRRTIPLAQREDTLHIGDIDGVSDVLIDPDHRLLVRRTRGQVVRFEWRAPEAREVALTGDFTSRALPATRVDDLWVVEVPLTAGQYAWTWIVDGRQAASGQRVVRPEHTVEAAYPRP